MLNLILENFFKNILIKSCLNSKKYSNEKKIEYIKLLNESIAVIPMMALAKSMGGLLFPKIKGFNISLRNKLAAMMDDKSSQGSLENTEELKELRNRYDTLMTRYEEIRYTGSKTEKQELEQEIRQLTSDIKDFLNKKENADVENYDLQNDEEVFEDEESYDEKPVEEPKDFDQGFDEPEQPRNISVNTNFNTPVVSNPNLSRDFLTNTRKGKNYGDLTFEIDSQASQIWSNIAFTKCNQYSGKPLWDCRGKAVEKSIAFIRSKGSLCSSTNNPEECKKSLIGLIDNWNRRKQFYSKKAR